MIEFHFSKLNINRIFYKRYLLSLESILQIQNSGSKGGGLSFAAAALDQRIDLCIADIPFLCDWKKYFEVTHWNELDDWFAQHPDANWTSVLNTLVYYDTKNLALNISCPVIMGISLQDDVCPPVTSFVTYHYIRSKKEFTIYKKEGHHQPETHYQDRFLKLSKIFRMIN